jgi:predicted dehydrogenase
MTPRQESQANTLRPVPRRQATSSRRELLGQVAGGTAWAAAWAGVASRALGANDRIRFGLIGAGSRGQEIFRAALRCPNGEAVAVADLYARRLNEAKSIAPAVTTYQDFRRLLDDKSIDAVLIATPQHQHALNFVPAIQAGKDVYQEKTMAFSPAHARRMRKALVGSGRVVQVGMQMNSAPSIAKIQEWIKSDRLGTITAIQAHHYRNAPYGGWLRPIPPDCDAKHVDWTAFEGDAPRHDFDPNRYVNWRFFWDYSGGNVFENMVHQIAYWFQVLSLSIPQTVTMAGGNFRSPKMEPPDTMSVSMKHSENLLFTWNSMFGNAYFGETHDYLFGTKGTALHDESDQIVFLPPGPGRQKNAAEWNVAPGYMEWTDHHMQNFFDCVRSRKEPNCPFEMGYRTAITCQMAVASYRLQRVVRWNSQAEEII